MTQKHYYDADGIFVGSYTPPPNFEPENPGDLPDGHPFPDLDATELPPPAAGARFDGKAWVPPPPSIDEIKSHFRYRLTSVIGSLAAQQNVAGWISAPEALLGAAAPTAEERTLYGEGVKWVAAMFAALRVIEAAPPTDFTDDNHWPVPPAGLAELASRF